MATRNSNAATDNANVVLWSYSTKIVKLTDRKTSAHSLHAELSAVNNLGVGVTFASPFTILA
jgi:hypothetical protein